MIKNIIKNVIEAESNELKKLTESLDYDVVNTLIDRIQNIKGNIFITGCGTSAMAAKKNCSYYASSESKSFLFKPIRCSAWRNWSDWKR